MRSVTKRLARSAALYVGVPIVVGMLLGPGELGGRVSADTGNPTNPIAAENAQTGTLDNWDVAGAGDPTIQGFATDISVNTGQTVDFKIQTDSTNFKIDIYRLGYYGG